MNRCKKCKDLFLEALYGELSEQENKNVQSHLLECPECKEEFKKLQATLKIMDTRKKPELTPDYWERYWDKLESEIINSKSSSFTFLNWWKNVKANFRFEVKWAYQFAGAVALILIGIFIGSYFTSKKENNIAETKKHISSTMNVDLTNRTSDYLQKSKILLLGLVNFDPELDDPYAIDLPQKKQISRELIVETNFLKNQMESSQQNQLYDLISDLEVILLQIANLESEYNLSAIEMVKSGVDRKGIFLKINIEEMRTHKSAEENDSKNEKKSENI